MQVEFFINNKSHDVALLQQTKLSFTLHPIIMSSSWSYSWHIQFCIFLHCSMYVLTYKNVKQFCLLIATQICYTDLLFSCLFSGCRHKAGQQSSNWAGLLCAAVHTDPCEKVQLIHRNSHHHSPQKQLTLQHSQNHRNTSFWSSLGLFILFLICGQCGVLPAGEGQGHSTSRQVICPFQEQPERGGVLTGAAAAGRPRAQTGP